MDKMSDLDKGKAMEKLNRSMNGASKETDPFYGVTYG